MRTRSLLPPGHGSFIHLQRVDDGLHGTSIGQQGHDDHDQFFRFAQSHQHRSLARAERFATRFTFVSLPLLSMTDQVACSNLSSCRTVQIRAK